MNTERRGDRSGLWTRRLAGAFIYAGTGMMFEVGATGLGRGPSRDFHGGVSLLMGLLYAAVYLLAPFLFRLIDRTGLKNVLLRAVPITVLIYAFEWSFGELCYAAGFNPWHYAAGMWGGLGAQAAAALPAWDAAVKAVLRVSHGAITLEMVPLWYLYALVIEPVLKMIGRTVDFLYAEGLLTWRGFWALSGNR